MAVVKVNGETMYVVEEESANKNLVAETAKR